uniref:Uncharacterized protein n=1 Tax=Sus scrofa TaxID=9823 RepID=A0A8D1UI28_PIG
MAESRGCCSVWARCLHCLYSCHWRKCPKDKIQTNKCECIWFGLLFLTFLLSLGWLYIGLILLNDLHNFNEFLFQHWGHWMDWSPAFLLVISLLVTYASVLLVGPGAAALTPQQPFFLPAQLYPGPPRGGLEGGVGLQSPFSDPSWHLMTPTTSAPSSWPCSCGSVASLCICTPSTRCCCSSLYFSWLLALWDWRSNGGKSGIAYVCHCRPQPHSFILEQLLASPSWPGLWLIPSTVSTKEVPSFYYCSYFSEFPWPSTWCPSASPQPVSWNPKTYLPSLS